MSKQTSSKRVLMLDGGGTIAQLLNSTHGTYRYLDPTRPFGWLKAADRSLLSEVASLEWQTAKGCAGNSNMRRPRDWAALAGQLRSARHDYDGFVVSHGTATLAYAASLLSFMLSDLDKPIVFTGAQTPLGSRHRGSLSDGIRNLYSSAYLAGSGLLREVIIAFGSRILRGNRATKLLTLSQEAFDSPNYCPLGRFEATGPVVLSTLSADVRRPLTVRNMVCDDRVCVVTINPTLLRTRPLIDEDARAIVVRGYAAGIVPKGLEQYFAELAAERLVVIHSDGATGCTQNRDILEENAPYIPDESVWAGDMTFEATLMKTCWVLGQTNSLAEQRRLISVNVAGEITVS